MECKRSGPTAEGHVHHYKEHIVARDDSQHFNGKPEEETAAWRLLVQGESYLLQADATHILHHYLLSC